MHYIISPWVIYGIGIIKPVIFLLIILSLVSMIVFFISTLQLIDNYNEEERKIINKFVKTSLVTLSISALLLVLIPSQETAYKMLIASYITTENISETHRFVKEELSSALEKVTDAVIKMKR